MSHQTLSGKVAIITGAAQGMGAATARIFAAEGARVVIADIAEDTGQALAQEIGASATFARLDVSDEAQWAAAVQHTITTFGTIDILVNNAAVVHFTPIEALDAAEAARVLQINIIGAMLGVKHVAPTMIAAERGAIVNISSVDGLRGCNGLSVYTASKWAIRGLSKTQAMELGPRGIRVNSLHPGGVDTPMGNPAGLSGDALQADYKRVPLQRIGNPEEIARATAFLASDAASYISGAELAVDGGWAAGYYQPKLWGSPDGLGS